MNRASSTALAFFAAAAGLPALPSRADDIPINRMPLSNAIARIDKTYGINVVLRGAYASDPLRRVTLTLDDSDKPSARFGAVTDLASALGATAVKGFVVTKIAPSDTAPSPKIDVGANVVFPNTTVPVDEAIRRIAEVDGANVQIAKDVTGTVTFPSVQMTAQAAADEVARQAGLRWKAYYALVPPGQAEATPFVVYGTLLKNPPPVQSRPVRADARRCGFGD
jgi:hypothetical protein